MSRPAIASRAIGREEQPIVVIDGFAPDPDALRAAAIATRFGPAGNHYPGIRAPLPTDYLADAHPVIEAALAEMLGRPVRANVIDASFSVVTTPAAALTMAQSLPHCDAFGAERIALVHYLSPEGGDGTAFFRHRSTGFETVDEARKPAYFERLNAEVREGNARPMGYIAGDTSLFECTAIADARYNRALLYRSYMLHSGAIAVDARLSPNPAIGRLTVTAFLIVE